MANIKQNNILCDSKKNLLTPQNEKVFLICFEKKPSNIKSRVGGGGATDTVLR